MLSNFTHGNLTLFAVFTPGQVAVYFCVMYTYCHVGLFLCVMYSQGNLFQRQTEEHNHTNLLCANINNLSPLPRFPYCSL